MSNKEKEDKTVILLNGKPFKVPPGGSLGVLALGNIGIRAWKNARKEWEEKQRDGREKK